MITSLHWRTPGSGGAFRISGPLSRLKTSAVLNRWALAMSRDTLNAGYTQCTAVNESMLHFLLGITNELYRSRCCRSIAGSAAFIFSISPPHLFQKRTSVPSPHDPELDRQTRAVTKYHLPNGASLSSPDLPPACPGPNSSVNTRIPARHCAAGVFYPGVEQPRFGATRREGGVICEHW